MTTLARVRALAFGVIVLCATTASYAYDEPDCPPDYCDYCGWGVDSYPNNRCYVGQTDSCAEYGCTNTHTPPYNWCLHNGGYYQECQCLPCY